MAQLIQKKRLINPPAKHHKKNPAALLTAANPPKKKVKKNPGPGLIVHRRKRRKNPDDLVSAGSALVRQGGVAFVAFTLTRHIPQMLLGSRNQGFLGYLANAGVAALTAYAAGRFGTRQDGHAAAIGGGLATISRAANEYLTPIGQFFRLSGIGDAMAVTKLGSPGRVGAIQPGFMFDAVPDGNGNPVLNDAFVEEMKRRMAAKPAAAPAMNGRGGSSPFSNRLMAA